MQSASGWNHRSSGAVRDSRGGSRASRVYSDQKRGISPNDHARVDDSCLEIRPMSNRFPATLIPPRTRLSPRDRQIPQRARRLALAAVVVGSIVLAPSASAQGQDPQRQGPPAGERMDPRQVIDQRMAMMTETLKLDSAQQTRIRSILADETMEMEALRKNAGSQRAGTGGQRGGRGGGRGGGRRGSAPPDSTGGGEGRGGSEGQSPEVRAIRDSTNKQIEGLLNAQQLTTYRQLFEQQQQQRPGGVVTGSETGIKNSARGRPPIATVPDDQPGGQRRGGAI